MNYVEKTNANSDFGLYDCQKCGYKIPTPYYRDGSYLYCPYCGANIKVYEVKDQ